MSLPYYKRFPRDFLEGTIGLSFEVKGAYAIVLDLIYMRDGRLPDDARYIAGQLGCSVRKWTAILAELVKAGKLHVQSGVITNFRADYLTEESRKYQDKQAEIAGNPRKNKVLCQPGSSQSEPEPEEGSEDKSSDAEGRVVHLDHDAEAWRQGVRLLTSQGRMTEAKARPFFGRLISTHKLEPRDLLPSLAKATVSGTQDPQGYLAKAAEAVAKRRIDGGKPKRVAWV